MPKLGEIRRGKDIGKSSGGGFGKYIWMACERCGKERWVALSKGKPTSKHFCNKCEGPRGADCHFWKGGRIIDERGYVQIRLSQDDFFYPMVSKRKYIAEHRLVMAHHLGRCLHPWEIVHHKNGIKDDNRIENLQLVSDERHKQITILENKIAFLEKRVTLLEAENAKLNEQLRQEMPKC